MLAELDWGDDDDDEEEEVTDDDDSSSDGAGDQLPDQLPKQPKPAIESDDSDTTGRLDESDKENPEPVNDGPEQTDDTIASNSSADIYDDAAAGQTLVNRGLLPTYRQ